MTSAEALLFSDRSLRSFSTVEVLKYYPENYLESSELWGAIAAAFRNKLLAING